MIKQILNRLPRKPHKSSENRDGSNSNSSSNTSTSSRNNNNNEVSNSRPSAHPSMPKITRTTNSSNPKTRNPTADPKFLTPTTHVPTSEKQTLFIRKLNLCCVVFDFTDPTKNPKEKEIKRQTLTELVDYVSAPNGKFPETVMQEIVKMVSVNIFRRLTPQPRDNKMLETFDGEEEEPSMDPSWPHLQLIYEFVLRFVASPETDPKLAKRYIDHSFVLKWLDLFDSEDPREREYLKFVLHRMYGKFMTEKHNGIAELLEILGSIINGFALPLKEEHKLFLVRALIPLHKPKCIPMYHQQISYCITQFVEKDCKLADTVIRYWPITNSSKEVMFLSELEEVLEATQPPEFQRCMVPLFRQIARCLSSSHFQVAERALFLWNNDHIENLIRQNRKVILPIIFPALERNTKTHWNQAVQSLTLNVRKIFNDADPQLFEECSRKFKDDESRKEETKSKREATWQRLEEVAALRSGGGCSNEPVLASQRSIANHISCHISYSKRDRTVPEIRPKSAAPTRSDPRPAHIQLSLSTSLTQPTVGMPFAGYVKPEPCLYPRLN
ncbi:hypothetical protein OSB04_000114 [Centaurea solstitialis]|uniref:Serine/threonine protein phosphatase 2A regulatory subunit n=1 Tax=Centaurea solstitialis TaxID=347529 RepID=A0AA38TNF9_9ASTR|nr:hypothetical protein OSB04_000114 [Centaurea solstitialis]